MSAAYEVIQLLEDLGHVTDGFVGTEPELPTAELTVTAYDTGGAATENWAGYQDPTIQIRVRAVSYVAGYSKAEQIRDALVTPHGFIFNDWYYSGFWLISDVAHIGRDDRNRELFTVNFRLMREPVET